MTETREVYLLPRPDRDKAAVLWDKESDPRDRDDGYRRRGQSTGILNVYSLDTRRGHAILR